MLDISALLFGASRVRTGRGYFGSRSSSRFQGQDHQTGYPPWWHRFAGRRTFHDRSSGCLGRAVRRISFRLPVFLLQSCQVSSGWPATSEGPPAYAWMSVEQSCITARSGERDFARHAIGSHGTRHPVWGKEMGTAMHCDARESSGPGCRPVPECLVVARVGRHRRRARRQVCNSQYLFFWPPHWMEQCWIGFLPGLETLEKKCCCKVPHVPLLTKTAIRSATSYPPQLCEEYATLWLNAMTNRNVSSTTRNMSTLMGRDGSSVLQSNASVFQPAMSKKHVKEAENEFHVGGLRLPIQSLYMVPGWEATGRRLWDCIDAALCNDTDASMLTRLYGQADFQSTFGVGRESSKRNLKGVRPGTSRNDEADILFGVMRVANDPDADTIQDWYTAHRWAWTER